MLPRVIQFNEVSVDGRMDGFTGDMGLYYGLAARLQPDAMLSGSETMLSGLAALDEPPEGEEAPPQEYHPLAVPLLAIVDSRGRIRKWRAIRDQPYWRRAVALCSRATPPEHREYLRQCRIETIVAGDDRVDLRAALEELRARFDVKVVRVDSGGRLNGVLFRAGLVDEVSVLIHPCLVGGTSPRSIFVAPDLSSEDRAIPLRLLHVETVQDNTLWLRYEVVR